MAAAWEENANAMLEAAEQNRKAIEAESRRTAERRAAMTPRQRFLEQVQKHPKRFYGMRRMAELDRLGQAGNQRRRMLAEIQTRNVKKPAGPLALPKRQARSLRAVPMPDFMREGITEYLTGPRPRGTLPAYGAEAIRRRRLSAVRRGNVARQKSKAAAHSRMFPTRKIARRHSAQAQRRSRSRTRSRARPRSA